MGSCNATTGACDCPENAIGEHCEACLPNQFGADCSVFCTRNDTCSNLGNCNNVTGLCDCDNRNYGGDCTVCKPGFYPADSCEVFCDRKTTCNDRGDVRARLLVCLCITLLTAHACAQCDEHGRCQCSNNTLFNPHDCTVQLWVIITPCVLVVALFGAFYAAIVYWKKRSSYDEFGEPLLGGF